MNFYDSMTELVKDRNKVEQMWDSNNNPKCLLLLLQMLGKRTYAQDIKTILRFIKETETCDGKTVFSLLDDDSLLVVSVAEKYDPSQNGSATKLSEASLAVWEHSIKIFREMTDSSDQSTNGFNTSKVYAMMAASALPGQGSAAADACETAVAAYNYGYAYPVYGDGAYAFADYSRLRVQAKQADIVRQEYSL